MNLRLFLFVSQKRGHTKSVKDSDTALGLLHQHSLGACCPISAFFIRQLKKYMWWWSVPLKADMIRAQ